MSDTALHRAGSLLSAIGVVVFVLGLIGSGLAVPSTVVWTAFEDLQVIAVLWLILGAIAWALGRTRSTIAPDQVNDGLRRAGFLLFVVGALGVIAGVVAWTLTQHATSFWLGIGEVGTVGFYLAIVGAIIVALSHRKMGYRLQPIIARR